MFKKSTKSQKVARSRYLLHQNNKHLPNKKSSFHADSSNSIRRARSEVDAYFEEEDK